MKRLVLVSLSFLFYTSIAFAQTKVDRYCQVTVDKVMYSKKNVKLYFGSEDSLFSFKDSSEIARLKRISKLTEAPDVLNYMSNLGWKLISVIAFGSDNLADRFYFKKEFDSNELK